MNASTIVESLRGVFQAVVQVLTTEVWTADTAAQLVALLAAWALALLGARMLRRLLTHGFEALGQDRVQARVRRLLLSLSLPSVWPLLLCFLVAGAARYQLSHELLRVGASLLAAWIAIRVVTSFVADPFWSRTVAVGALNRPGFSGDSVS